MTKLKRLYFLFLLISFAPTIYGQTFLNGSFENNTVTNCIIDIDNSTFDSVMTNVKGIGELQSLDIFYFNDCPLFNSAQSGNYFVSLENTFDSTKSTAVSIKLSDTLQIGNPYSFCFFDRGLTLGVGPIEIGICNNDSSFGSLIYTSPTADTAWTQRTVSFNAPLTGNYITARYKHSPPPYNGVLIDNFHLCSATGISENNFGNELLLFPNPTFGNFSIDLGRNYNSVRITIIDLNGKVILSSNYHESQLLNFKLAEPAGLYLLMIESGGERAIFRLVKQ